MLGPKAHRRNPLDNLTLREKGMQLNVHRLPPITQTGDIFRKNVDATYPEQFTPLNIP